jgi:hypothetical protein
MARRGTQGPSVSFFAFQDIITSVVGIFVLITLIMMIDLVSKANSTTHVRKRFQDTFSEVIESLREQLDQLERRSDKLERDAQSLGSVVTWNQKETLKELESAIDVMTQQATRSQQRTQDLQRVIEDQRSLKLRLEIESKNRSPDREELVKLLAQLEKLNSKLGDLQTEEPLVFKSQSLNGRAVIIVDVSSAGISVLDLANDQRKEWQGSGSIGQWKSWFSQQRISSLHFFVLIRPGAAKLFATVKSELERSGAIYGYDLMDGPKPLRLRSEATQ